MAFLDVANGATNVKVLIFQQTMTRGNQRDLAREKAAKKSSKKKSSNEMDGNKGTSLESRKQRDADIMREKQAAKAAAKAAKEGGGAGGGSK